MSGRKDTLLSFTLISGSAISVTSVPQNIQFYDNIWIQGDVISGSPSGTFVVQGSNTYNPNTGTGTWVTLLTATITSGSPATSGMNVNQAPFPWIRVVYTLSSGSGTVNVVLSGKML